MLAGIDGKRDVQARLAFPHERRFFFDPPENPGRQVLIHPQPDDTWRIDWQVPAKVPAVGTKKFYIVEVPA